ncbi:phospholipase C [Microbacterium elymi]|uniref:Alkaline phosphatase family protein n=1 Tax=Microbacterium elymi TaxID=2909587 RepID=A0ABY5NHC5_9MICO|nr:alkaline phosphatase family protein [Microbacterium elymi]UUT34511.1 alkaline phosphatase family protein [Microbacterium elymi]
MVQPRHRARAAAVLATLAVALVSCAPAPTPTPVPTRTASAPASASPSAQATTTPIRHLVVIFGENVSFDHYFGTYPVAANTDGTPFHAASDTAHADTLTTSGMLTHNPNASAPRRLTHEQALTCDQDHDYTDEQRAMNGGRMDRFVEHTSRDACRSGFGEPGLVMDYYDGNTVTALWNYAQRFAMSDNSWDTVFGPSTPGAIDLISGQTWGMTLVDPHSGAVVRDPARVAAPDAQGRGTLITDVDPALDDCSRRGTNAPLGRFPASSRTIGDLLSAAHVTWGWFSGGFRPTSAWDAATGAPAQCGASRTNVGGARIADYVPHHEPFQYYPSTANPHHLPPTSVAMIGYDDRAHHQYDLTDFDAALTAGRLPAVSFLKAPGAQDGHAGSSDPLDEQAFLVGTLNRLQTSADWASTAVVIAYDDSDGWYDHVAPTILNASRSSDIDAAICADAAAPVAGGQIGRCGPSQRLPLAGDLALRAGGAIDHTATEQTSILRFIEDNWRTGRIGGGSFDARAGTLDGLFDFDGPPHAEPLLLDANGSVRH